MSEVSSEMQTAEVVADIDQKNGSQKDKVLEYLQAGKALTQDEAQMSLGIRNLSTRINELRDEGWNIKTELISVDDRKMPVAKYELIMEQPRKASPFLPVNVDGIPAELKVLPHWVLWRGRQRNDKMTKEPFQLDGMKAKTNDSNTWAPFDVTYQAYQAGMADGIGFVFSKNGGLVGVDLDHCFDDDGVIKKEAADIVSTLGSYTEYSVSGSGLHIVVHATLESGRRQGALEIYPHGRYFTVTGRVYGDVTEIRSAQDEIDKLVQSMDGKKSSAPRPFTGIKYYLNNTLLIRKAKLAKNGAKFSRLWEGDITGYPSQSEADLALVCMLLFWTNGDIDRTNILFSQSELGKRTKWNRADYRRQTLRKAQEFAQGAH